MRVGSQLRQTYSSPVGEMQAIDEANLETEIEAEYDAIDVNSQV